MLLPRQCAGRPLRRAASADDSDSTSPPAPNGAFDLPAWRDLARRPLRVSFTADDLSARRDLARRPLRIPLATATNLPARRDAARRPLRIAVADAAAASELLATRLRATAAARHSAAATVNHATAVHSATPRRNSAGGAALNVKSKIRRGVGCARGLGRRLERDQSVLATRKPTTGPRLSRG
jgi:hypothetical protein